MQSSFILDLFPDVLLDIIVSYLYIENNMFQKHLILKEDNKNYKIARTYECQSYGLIFATPLPDKYPILWSVYSDFYSLVDYYAREKQTHKDNIILTCCCVNSCIGLCKLFSYALNTKYLKKTIYCSS